MSIFIYSGVPVITLNKNSTTARLQPSFLCLSVGPQRHLPSATAPARLPAAPPPRLSPWPALAQPRAAPRTGTSGTPTLHGLAWWHVTLSRLSQNSTYISQLVLSAPQGPKTAGTSRPTSVLVAVRRSRWCTLPPRSPLQGGRMIPPRFNIHQRKQTSGDTPIKK